MEIGAKLVQYPYPTEVSYAVPTAEEILERLPRYYVLHRNHDGYKCFGGTPIHHEDGHNGAEAAGKIWLYLKEQDFQ